MHKQDKMRSRKGLEELLKLGADYVPSQRRSCKLAADGASSNRLGMDVAANEAICGQRSGWTDGTLICSGPGMRAIGKLEDVRAGEALKDMGELWMMALLLNGRAGTIVDPWSSHWAQLSECQMCAV